MLSTIRKAVGLLAGTAFGFAFSTGAMAVTPITFGETNLTLINGWHVYPAPVSVPSVTLANGIVRLEGAIQTAASNTNAEPFVLPVGFRPAKTVFVPVDTSHADNGRLVIEPNGAVFVGAQEGQYSNAQAFTSLEGVAFALNGAGATPLTLMNGWTNGPYGAANASVRSVGGIVYLAGAIANGSNKVVFKLPANFAPASFVLVPVDLCNSTNGRLDISSTGTVEVIAEGNAFSNAQCFTSLDGVSFARTAAGSTPLTLINGWTPAYATGTASPSVYMYGGVIHLEGAMATYGTNPAAFVLPSGFRPTALVSVKADLCGAHNGQLFIETNGTVQVEAEGNQFSNAQCFTSLDGASFAQ
jgi:hypothetical protein